MAKVWALEPGSVSEAVVRALVVEGRHTVLEWGPFGSGKSVTMCHAVYLLSLMQPLVNGKRRSRWAFVRNTSDQLRQTTLATWLEWFPENEVRRWKSSERVYEWREGDFELEILFLPLDTPDDVRKLLSLELTGVFLNEAREVERTIWDGVDGRVGRYPPARELVEVLAWGALAPSEVGRYWRRPIGEVGAGLEEVYVRRGEDGVLTSSKVLDGGWEWAKAPWSGVLADSNPSSTDDWLWKQFFERAVEDEGIGWKYTGYRQPPGLLRDEVGRWVTNRKAENLRNLKPGYYENLAKGKAEPWVRMYCCGEPIVLTDGKAVFPQFDQSWHVEEFEFDPRLEVFAGWDFAINGQACLLVQVSARGQVRVFDEFVGEMGTLMFARDVVRQGLAKWRGARYQLGWSDPAGGKRADTDEKSSLELVNDAYPDMPVGLPFKTYPARTNALQARLDAVNWFLSGTVPRRDNTEKTGPRILVHSRCKTLIAAMAGRYEYRRVQTSEERYTEVPAKTHPWSDVADALQYVCLGLLSHLEWGQSSDEGEARREGSWQHGRSRRLSGY